MRSVPTLSPLWGQVWRVLGRTGPTLSRWLFSSATVVPSRAAPPPAQTLPCVSQINFQTSVKWLKAGVGPWAVSGAAARCQPSKQHEGKGRCDGRLLLSGRAPLEPQPHCMQQLFCCHRECHGKAVGRGGVGPEPCCETFRRRTTRCLARSNARRTRRTLLLRRRLGGLTPLVAMACCSCSKQGDRLRVPEARSAVPWPAGACPAVLLQHSLPFLLPCPLRFSPPLFVVVFLVADWQCPSSGVCTARALQCFSPICPGQPPTSSSTFEHTLPAFRVYLLRGVGHVLPNIVPGPGIVAITLVLISLLVLEMYRFIKFVRVHDVALQVEEEEAVEVRIWYRHAHPAALCLFVLRWHCFTRDAHAVHFQPPCRYVMPSPGSTPVCVCVNEWLVLRQAALRARSGARFLGRHVHPCGATEEPGAGTSGGSSRSRRSSVSLGSLSQLQVHVKQCVAVLSATVSDRHSPAPRVAMPCARHPAHSHVTACLVVMCRADSASPCPSPA
jgi:hypothetical protein